MDFSLYGLLEWVQVSGKNLEVARNLSNTLIFLYYIAYLTNKKGCFIAVFLFVELVGNSFIISGLSDSGYYLSYSFLYCICYAVVVNVSKSIKTLAGYVILILFELTMSYNEWKQPEIETFFYTYYEYIIVAIHIYIISTVFDRRAFDRFTRGIIVHIRYKCCVSYSVGFFWYNLRQSNLETPK